jgi:hypothetical protein
MSATDMASSHPLIPLAIAPPARSIETAPWRAALPLYRILRAIILSALLVSLAWPVTAEALRLAVFNFELIDTSLEGQVFGARADEQKRLAMISDELRHLLIDEGGYTVVDLAPAADAIAKAGLLFGCPGCAADIAKRLGARLALTGTVQKVSDLILNINVYVWDTQSGQERYQTSVDIRGNTDESWSRGLSYLVRNQLLEALAKIGAN